MPSELEACREGKGSLIRAFLPWHRQRQMHMGECTCCPPRGTPSPVRMNDQEAVSIELVLQHMFLPSLLLSIKLKEHLFPWKPTLPEQKRLSIIKPRLSNKPLPALRLNSDAMWLLALGLASMSGSLSTPAPAHVAGRTVVSSAAAWGYVCA